MGGRVSPPREAPDILLEAGGAAAIHSSRRRHEQARRAAGQLEFGDVARPVEPAFEERRRARDAALPFSDGVLRSRAVGDRAHILFVEDDALVRARIETILRDAGLHVHSAPSGEEALLLLEAFTPDASLLDIELPGIDGRAVLRTLRFRLPHAPVVMLTGHREAELAVECMKAGAWDYLVKPVEDVRLLATISNAVRQHALVCSMHAFRRAAGGELPAGLVGESPAFLALLADIERAAQGDQPVLVLGEAGTERAAVARAGPAGAPGAPGADGKSVLNGDVDPSASTGADGDFYFNTATGTMFGPKTAGAWPSSSTSLVGPQGPQGPQGPAGSGSTEVTAVAPITSSGTSTVTIGISAATSSAAGSMSAADKAKLDAFASASSYAPLAAPTFTGTVTAGAFSGPLTGNVTGNVSGTAGSLAANGTNCGAGQFATGVDASGNAEGCTVPSGTYALPDATSSVTGGVRVTNDLAGSATSPTVVSTHLASALPVAQGGTGQASQQAAIDALTGTQSAGKYLRSDGQHATLSSIDATDLQGVLQVSQGGTGLTATQGLTALAPATTTYQVQATDRVILTQQGSNDITWTLPSTCQGYQILVYVGASGSSTHNYVYTTSPQTGLAYTSSTNATTSFNNSTRADFPGNRHFACGCVNNFWYCNSFAR